MVNQSIFDEQSRECGELSHEMGNYSPNHPTLKTVAPDGGVTISPRRLDSRSSLKIEGSSREQTRGGLLRTGVSEGDNNAR